jgi:sortase B
MPGGADKPFYLRPRFILLILFAAVFVLSATMLILDSIRAKNEENAFRELAAAVAQTPSSAPGNIPESPPAHQTSAALLKYQELHKRNADMAGWIRVDGTSIDYPVMYTADDFYLSHGFDKKAARSGVPFIDPRCTVDPPGTNTIIYGHHMKNGTMFATLENYKDEDHYRAHPIIRFDTLYEEQEYEIIAAFESQIYRKSDTVFKHYDFLKAGSEADFDEYLTNIKALSLYDTGLTASYGDELLTLITCDYHTKNGQFVVVARKTE